MAKTIRQQILEHILDELQRPIWGMGSVYPYQPAAVDQGIWKSPVCFVWAESEVAASGEVPDTAIQLESWRMSVAVEVHGKKENIEDYLGQIHKAMALDCSWGGHALDTARISSDIMEYDSTREEAAFQAIFAVWYRHANGDPYTAV